MRFMSMDMFNLERAIEVLNAVILGEEKLGAGHTPYNQATKHQCVT